MDSILLYLLDSTDEDGRERRLGEILSERAAPLIWETIRRRFGHSTRHAGGVPDLEDLRSFREFVHQVERELQAGGCTRRNICRKRMF